MFHIVLQNEASDLSLKFARSLNFLQRINYQHLKIKVFKAKLKNLIDVPSKSDPDKMKI